MSDQIAALTGVARDEGDYQSEQFLQWFLKEQVEEVATMSSLLAVVERSSEDADVRRGLPRPRAHQRGDADPTAPPAAGGSLCPRGALSRSARCGATTCWSPRRIVTFSASRCSSSAWANLREVPSSSRSWASVIAPPSRRRSRSPARGRPPAHRGGSAGPGDASGSPGIAQSGQVARRRARSRAAARTRPRADARSSASAEAESG